MRQYIIHNLLSRINSVSIFPAVEQILQGGLQGHNFLIAFCFYKRFYLYQKIIARIVFFSLFFCKRGLKINMHGIGEPNVYLAFDFVLMRRQIAFANQRLPYCKYRLKFLLIKSVTRSGIFLIQQRKLFFGSIYY